MGSRELTKSYIRTKPNFRLDKNMGQLLELPKSLANDWREVNMKNFGVDLSFSDIPEWQRTKHVHRLHPYLGKFIPQLVNVFLKKYFNPNQ